MTRYYREESYRCIACRDKGVVCVWHPKFIAWAKSVYADEWPDLTPKPLEPIGGFIAALANVTRQVGKVEETRRVGLIDWPLAREAFRAGVPKTAVCACTCESGANYPSLARFSDNFLPFDEHDLQSLYEFTHPKPREWDWTAV